LLGVIPEGLTAPNEKENRRMVDRPHARCLVKAVTL